MEKRSPICCKSYDPSLKKPPSPAFYRITRLMWKIRNNYKELVKACRTEDGRLFHPVLADEGELLVCRKCDGSKSVECNCDDNGNVKCIG